MTPKQRKANCLKQLNKARRVCVGVPTPSGHDTMYIRTTKHALRTLLRESHEEEFDPENGNCGGTYWNVSDNGTFYWN